MVAEAAWRSLKALKVVGKCMTVKRSAKTWSERLDAWHLAEPWRKVSKHQVSKNHRQLCFSETSNGSESTPL